MIRVEGLRKTYGDFVAAGSALVAAALYGGLRALVGRVGLAG